MGKFEQSLKALTFDLFTVHVLDVYGRTFPPSLKNKECVPRFCMWWSFNS